MQITLHLQGGAAPDSQALHKVRRATRRVIGCTENAILINPEVASLFLLFSRKSLGWREGGWEGRALPISRYFNAITLHPQAMPGISSSTGAGITQAQSGLRAALSCCTLDLPSRMKRLLSTRHGPCMEKFHLWFALIVPTRCELKLRGAEAKKVFLIICQLYTLV